MLKCAVRWRDDMILVHLSVTGKAAIIDPEIIMFAEDCEGEQDGKPITFTRIYLKQPLPGENESSFIDVQESVQKIAKELR